MIIDSTKTNTVSNYSNNQDVKDDTQTQDSKKDESLWESFCNEVIAPAVDDAVRGYIDDTYGTNLVEQKEQQELEKTYEEVLAQQEVKENQSIGQDITQAFVDSAFDELSKSIDENYGTNVYEKRMEQKEEDAKLLEDAQAYQAEKEAQEQSGGFFQGLLRALFNLD